MAVADFGRDTGMTAFSASDYTGLYSQLTRYAMRLTRNRADAEDLTQDTMERGWKHRDAFAGRSEVMTWLVAIMRNRYFELRKHGPMESLDAMEFPPELEMRCSGASNVTLHEVSAAIDLLEPQFCECFCLRAYGLEYGEISRQLGIPIGTVKSRIFRAREQLERAT